MKNKTIIAVLLILGFSLSGCLGIEEKILIHKDGTGTFTYTIDATQMMKQLMDFANKFAKAFESDSTSTTKSEKKLQDPAEKAMKELKDDFAFNKDHRMDKVKGISGYREFVDTVGGKMLIGLSFNFQNVSALNNGLKTMFKKGDKSKKTDGLPPATYAFKNGVLTREMGKEQVEGLVGGDTDGETVKKLMKDFKYVVVVESDEPIQTAEAPGAKIENAGKKLVIDYLLMEKNDEIVQSKMKSTVKVY